MSPSDAVWVAPAVVAASVAGAMALTSETIGRVWARRDRRAAEAREDVLAAFTALRALRTAYRRQRALDVADLEDALLHAVAMTLDPRAVASAQEYLLVATRSRRDRDAGDAEQVAYRALSAVLQRHLARHR